MATISEERLVPVEGGALFLRQTAPCPAPATPTVPFDPAGTLLDRLAGRPPRHRPQED